MNPKEQSEFLMNELFAFAEKMLIEYGEFHPFGGYLDSNFSIVHVGIDGHAKQEEQQRVDTLVNSFRGITGNVLAFGIATNVSLPLGSGEKANAIQVFLEHKDGYCADVFFSYELSPTDGVEIVETTAQQGEPIIFK